MTRKLTFLAVAILGSSDRGSLAERESSNPAGFRRGLAHASAAAGLSVQTAAGLVDPRS